MSNDALISAVQTAGSQTAFAKAIGASQQIVSYWVSKGKSLPAEYVLRAEQAFAIPRYVLRPDVFPLDHAQSLNASEASLSPGNAQNVTAAQQSEAA
jgi:DNA-binding transcriptional regulator YdaS (Cro superfamily)